MIEVKRKNLSLDAALLKEWLDTDGHGGYASSSILHCHTRKYHGLMVAHLPESGGRFVLLSKLEDSVVIGETETHLSMHQYPMVFAPPDMPELISCNLDLHPRFAYEIGQARVDKEILVPKAGKAVLIRYRYTGGHEPILLRIKPLLAFRGIHELSRENNWIRTDTEIGDGGFSIAPYEGMPRLFAATGGMMRFTASPCWYRAFEYALERERGFSYQEDLLMPGVLEGSLEPGTVLTICFSLEEEKYPRQLWNREIQRRKRRRHSLRQHGEGKDILSSRLQEAAESFIIEDSRGRTSIIAGYHWFYVWGRDTLISLPGLTFCRGRIREGIDILKTMGDLRRDGLIPNCLADGQGDDAYNSVDASLWYFWCLQELLRVSGDAGVIRRHFWPVMKDILGRYRNGREPVVRLESGLIAVGDRTTQLTWMDASVGSVPVTPRGGCPVEINALWFNALSFTRDMSKMTGLDPGFDVAAEIEGVARTFNDLFWIPDRHYLADVWNTSDGSRDVSMRPNQIFAVSLPFSPLDNNRAKMVVQKVTDELLTPYGLRTLSPHDPRYRGHYGGDSESRNGAYHQGTVWPWLLGHYGEAFLKTQENRKKALNMLRSVLENFKVHLSEAGIGFVSEVIDGEEPWKPGGCIAQAWSVAEVFRLSRLIEREEQDLSKQGQALSPRFLKTKR